MERISYSVELGMGEAFRVAMEANSIEPHVSLTYGAGTATFVCDANGPDLQNRIETAMVIIEADFARTA